MDYTVDSFVRNMIKSVIIISILMMAGGAVFFRSYFAVGFALGIGMTMVLNVVKIKWLAYCVTQATSMETNRGGAFVSIHYLLRFALTGLVVTAAHFLPVVDMFGAVIGLLALPFSNYVVHFFKRGGASASDNEVEPVLEPEAEENSMNEEPQA